MPTYKSHLGKKLRGESCWAVRIGCGSVGQSELGAAASRKAVWWDLHLASLLMHLLLFYFIHIYIMLFHSHTVTNVAVTVFTSVVAILGLPLFFSSLGNKIN